MSTIEPCEKHIKADPLCRECRKKVVPPKTKRPKIDRRDPRQVEFEKEMVAEVERRRLPGGGFDTRGKDNRWRDWVDEL